MLTNRLISRLVFGVALLAAGATLPAVAHAHDGRGEREWRHNHDNRGDRHRHWEHRRWEHRHWQHRHQPHVYERPHVQPRVYYAPAPVFPPPPPGVTLIYRDRW